MKETDIKKLLDIKNGDIVRIDSDLRAIYIDSKLEIFNSIELIIALQRFITFVKKI